EPLVRFLASEYARRGAGAIGSRRRSCESGTWPLCESPRPRRAQVYCSAAEQESGVTGWHANMRAAFRAILTGVLVGGGLVAPAGAQDRQANRPPVQPRPIERRLEAPLRSAPGGHRFWDKTNDVLFAGVAASRTLDYFSTLNMRRRGRQEILLSNEAVDNHAAFAAIEAAGTGISMGASYLFHRYGHHKLERWVSIVHIGLATSGSVRNYCLKTFHTVPASAAP